MISTLSDPLLLVTVLITGNVLEVMLRLAVLDSSIPANTSVAADRSTVLVLDLSTTINV